MTGRVKSTYGALGALWGIGGVVALLTYAIVRLSPIAAEALAGSGAPLSPLHWVAVVGSILFFGYTEGYKAFQRQFSPRVVARGLSLLESPTPLRVVLAPFFCMGFFGATRKRIVVSWSLAAAIVVLVRLVGALPQPWRGIIDLGVVFALAWGALAILAFAARALAGAMPGVAADLPEGEAA